MENPSELIYHSYWPVVYSISTCTLICLLINWSLADSYSVVLPIVMLSSYWMIATIYLQSHSHLSMYISTCTYARDGQLLSWSNLLANSESHQTLTLLSSSILVSLATFIVCFASKSETEDQGHPQPFHQVSPWQGTGYCQVWVWQKIPGGYLCRSLLVGLICITIHGLVAQRLSMCFITSAAGWAFESVKKQVFFWHHIQLNCIIVESCWGFKDWIRSLGKVTILMESIRSLSGGYLEFTRILWWCTMAGTLRLVQMDSRWTPDTVPGVYLYSWWSPSGSVAQCQALTFPSNSIIIACFVYDKACLIVSGTPPMLSWF